MFYILIKIDHYSITYSISLLKIMIRSTSKIYAIRRRKLDIINFTYALGNVSDDREQSQQKNLNFYF